MNVPFDRWILVTGVCLTLACKKEATPASAAAASVESPVAAASPAHVQEMLANFQRVYFDTDSSELNDTSRAVLAANATIMQAHPEVRVQIQGHADERGTSDYNLALGQRRADVVQASLLDQGVSTSRTDLISYGEEMPVSTAHDERAWSQNRRVEFRVIW